MVHDHSKLNPLISLTDKAILSRDYVEFRQCVKACLAEIKKHIDWEESRWGVIHEIEEMRPELRAEIDELRSDHLYMMNKLKRSATLAMKSDDYAFSLFKQFKMRRKEHVFHEDELDVKAHTVELH